MKRIKKKLHSQSGASFLFALLAFLVAAMVSVTIVSAALTTVKRINNDREAQQAQLTLISAAQFVRDEMKETRYVITETTTTTTTTGEGGIEETHTSVSVDKTAEGTFKDEMKAAVEYVDMNEDLGKSYVAENAFQITAVGSEFEMKMKPVNVSFVMKSGIGEKYHLFFTLSIDGTGETLFLKMTSRGIEYYDTIVSGNTTKRIDRICWINGIIGGIGDTNEAKT